jgi:hypothetical protein
MNGAAWGIGNGYDWVKAKLQQSRAVKVSPTPKPQI